MKYKIQFLLFLSNFILINFCAAQAKIFVLYENSPGIFPQFSRPCFIAELNVNDCSLKKVIDLDSLKVRGTGGGSLILNKNTNKVSVVRMFYAAENLTVYNIDLKKKLVTDSIVLPPLFNSSSQFVIIRGFEENKIMFPMSFDSLMEIDLVTKNQKKLWKIAKLPNNQGIDYPMGMSSGSWINGKLVLMTQYGIVEVNLNKDEDFTFLLKKSQNAMPAPAIFCTASTTCDTSIVYAIDATQSALYRLDLKNKTSTYLCKNAQFEEVRSMQSQSDYLQTKCGPLIDLDENDNSGKTKNDYTTTQICTPSVPILINDKDLIVNSSVHIDSIRCYIFSGQKDGKQEQLQCFLPNNSTVSVKGNNSNNLTLINNKWAKSLEFAEAIRQIRYVNKNAKFTKGERVIALQMYAQGEKSDTAKAFLLLIREDAGKDSIVSICKKTPVLLTDYLNGASNKNGKLYPNLSSGTALFNPQKDKFGKYLYVLTGICNADTSILKLNDYSTSFVKNIDTTLCFANTFKIKNKEYKTSGVYQESYPYQNGCDSLIINVKLTIRPEAISKIDTVLIEGQNYTINKQNINKSGDYAIKLTNRFGCDSTINLKVIVKESDIKKYIPSVFTPDGEQIENQVFKILESAPIKQIKKLYIFNRWGEMVFKVENVSHKDTKSFWDGTFNNQKLASDVYIYHLEVETAIETPSINGEITLLR